MESARPWRRARERWGLQLRAWSPDAGDLPRRRREYATLRDRHNNDPRGDPTCASPTTPAANLAANNPLTAAQDSPWAVHFRNQEARGQGLGVRAHSAEFRV